MKILLLDNKINDIFLLSQVSFRAFNMNDILEFAKKEKVFTIALAFAIASCFFVVPDSKYLSYMDFRTLALLYSLMVVVSGVRKAGLFEVMADGLCERATNLRGLGVSLVLMTFVLSMLITNDVALISFVPFSILVLGIAGAESEMIWVVVCQTVAANLGSMLTPVGNPQNLYLYSHYNFNFTDFLMTTLPVWGVSIVLVLGLCFKLRREEFTCVIRKERELDTKSLPIYGALFLVCLLVVFRIMSWPIMLGIVILSLLLFDRKTLLDADFALLATFVFFFIFSGNLERINSLHIFLAHMMNGREFITSLLCSQVISNVPAALLLSAFTENGKELILGTDIGGLGTPIASLASLIGFKQYCQHMNAKPGKFMVQFLIVNFILLGILIGIKYLVY